MTQVAPWETWDWPVPDGTTGASLADTVERSTADLLVAVAPLSDDALATPGTFDRWSGHDLLAHCAAWAEICARVLEELDAGTLDLADYEDLPVGDAEDETINQRQVDELRDVPADDLVQRIELARDRSARVLRGFDGAPPAALVLLTFGDHFDDHAAAFREAADV